jgi:tetratricopeptide (TPR) repeat protein
MITLSNYAKLLHDMRELDLAEALYRESLAIGARSVGEEHPQMASAYADLSGVVAKLGRADEAVELARRSLGIRERVYGADHGTVAASLAYLAQAFEARGDDLAAGPLHRRAVEMLRRPGISPPRLAEALVTQGLFLLRTASAREALGAIEEAVALFREAVPPDDRRRARAESALGACLARLGRYDEAEALLAGSLARLALHETVETAEARARLAELRALRGS